MCYRMLTLIYSLLNVFDTAHGLANMNALLADVGRFLVNARFARWLLFRPFSSQSESVGRVLANAC